MRYKIYWGCAWRFFLHCKSDGFPILNVVGRKFILRDLSTSFFDVVSNFLSIWIFYFGIGIPSQFGVVICFVSIDPLFRCEIKSEIGIKFSILFFFRFWRLEFIFFWSFRVWTFCFASSFKQFSCSIEKWMLRNSCDTSMKFFALILAADFSLIQN